MIYLEVDNQRYEGFTKVSVVRYLDPLSGSFNFRATSEQTVPLPIERGQSCRVLIDDEPVINGYVETINVSYEPGNHEIEIAGRDKTMDVIDSSTLLKEVTGTISLSGVIKKMLTANGITGISVINNVSGLENFKEGDIESAGIGETMFEFMEKYARKRQVLLTGDGNGNIVITRAGTVSAQTALLNVINGQNNNIKSGSVSYRDTALFNRYVVRSQMSPVALEGSGSISSSEISDQSGEAVDADVRSTRIVELQTDQSGSDNDNTQFALWSKNIARAKSFNYTATVQGHHQDEEKTRLWVPNEIVSVKDDFAGMGSRVDAKLLIKSVEYKLSNDSGSTTTLNCVDKNSYTLQAEQDAREARANDLGI